MPSGFPIVFAFLLISSCIHESASTPEEVEPSLRMHIELPTSLEISQLPEDGGDEFNRLIFESSPYLLQHARNPIEWRAWGDEALDLAVAEKKPIFLSIGYTTCHWCHVMERESFEDEEVAHLLNQYYICIKVDREERPDLDHVYMAVTQMMTGRGGWPMTVIMTPEKVPFFAGTYFPKSSMLDLLPHFARVWKEEKEKVNEIGQAILHNLSKSRESQTGGDLNATHLDRCFEALSVAYDPVYGGFGSEPKFPTPHALSFLLRYYQRTGELSALEMVTHTLTQIRLSGTYDQIGWGIHRYSTDQEWLVPHFEKMLYDQALYSIACIEAYQITKDPFFREACENTLAYVERDLSDPMGGFYSAVDADSEGEEGKFYVWSINEIRQILSEKEADLFIDTYRFQTSGNFLDEASGKKTGSNIPHLSQALSQLAKSQKEESKKFSEQIEMIREKLFQARKKRIHPQLDDKVLTDWNGLMISAFAKASQVLKSQSYLDRARKAADFCLTELRQKNGRLYKRWRQEKAGLPAHLEDYAFLIQGLLDLYEASLDPIYLRESKVLTDLTRTLFEDVGKGGFFLTAHDGEKLLTRPKEIYDGAIPSGNSIMSVNLARIWKITGDERYRNCLNQCFSAFSGFLKTHPSGAENFLHALAFTLNPPYEIVIAGDLQKKQTQSFLEEVKLRFLPFKTLVYLPNNQTDHKLIELAPYLEALVKVKEPTFFLCRDYGCDQPRSDLDQVIETLDHLAEPNKK